MVQLQKEILDVMNSLIKRLKPALYTLVLIVALGSITYAGLKLIASKNPESRIAAGNNILDASIGVAIAGLLFSILGYMISAVIN